MPEITVTLPEPAEGKEWHVVAGGPRGERQVRYFEQVDKPSEFVMVKLTRDDAKHYAEHPGYAVSNPLWQRMSDACTAALAEAAATPAETRGNTTNACEDNQHGLCMNRACKCPCHDLDKQEQASRDSQSKDAAKERAEAEFRRRANEIREPRMESHPTTPEIRQDVKDSAQGEGS